MTQFDSLNLIHINSNKVTFAMKITITCLIALVLAACANTTDHPDSTVKITRSGQQDSLFQNLMATSGNTIPPTARNDSLAFLVLPVQASCPSCRDKTIDSIMKHQASLRANHFIILSASGGRKTINSYFRERNVEIPDLGARLILDSTNQANQYDLYKDNPAIYYSVNSKVYKKVLAIPVTVKQDLQEFFSGWRSEDNKY